MSQEICLFAIRPCAGLFPSILSNIYNVVSHQTVPGFRFTPTFMRNKISLSKRDSEHDLSIEGQIGLAHIGLAFFLCKWDVLLGL